jgi:K+-sensing histidine kinase KdpD
MSDSHEAEARLFREAERMNRQARCGRRADAPRRYGLATLWVFLAFAYCCQWDDMASIPPGVCTLFLMAVAFAFRWGGIGPGWLAFALSIGSVWLRFAEPVISMRYCWLVLFLLTPMIVATPRTPARRIFSKLKPGLFRSLPDPPHYPIWSDRPSR